jgi:hypothetical protein
VWASVPSLEVTAAREMAYGSLQRAKEAVARVGAACVARAVGLELLVAVGAPERLALPDDS